MPFPSPGHLPDPGIKPRSPALQADSLPLSHQGSPLVLYFFSRLSLFFFFLMVIVQQLIMIFGVFLKGGELVSSTPPSSGINSLGPQMVKNPPAMQETTV